MFPTKGALALLKRVRKVIGEPGKWHHGGMTDDHGPETRRCVLGWMSTLDANTRYVTYPTDNRASNTYKNAATILLETINGDPYRRSPLNDPPVIRDGLIVEVNDGYDGKEKILSALDRTIRYAEDYYS